MDDFIKRLKKVSNYIEAQEDNVDQLVYEIADYKSQLQDSSGDDRLKIESNLAFVENELTRLTQHLEELKKQVRKEMESHLGK
jgi:hypothetical protein